MKFLDKRTSGDLVKLMIFIIVTTLSTGVLVVLIGNFTFQASRTYDAVFTDATGVVKGDDIRVAGVKVGSVKNVKIIDRTRAEIEFSVAKATIVTQSSNVAIRYRNLVGQRYLSVSEGAGNTAPLPAGATIPMSRTQPALDLTVLFNGFKPLFAALSPTDINKLSYELIQVFQGEGGNLEGLLQSTASITQTLADRDQVIGSLINNLNVVLKTFTSRNAQFSDLIVQLRTFLHGLNQDRNVIFDSLDSVSNLTQQTADLATGIRPSFVQDVKGLRGVATNLDKGKDEIDRALQILPIKLTKIGRTAIYGSFFNFYLCQFQGRIKLPGGSYLPITDDTGGARCHLT
jgi:phospholipid/cholesterol/gamma-HCH transport system substrate-binding protein